MSYVKTENAIDAYLANCGPAAVGQQVPNYLALTLRERYAQLQANQALAADWAAQYEQWAVHADGHYRCLVSTRPAEAPWFRLGVKDTVDVAGLPTRLGLRSYRHYPARSAEALTWLDPRVALTCKVTTTELNIAFGGGCRNPLYPSIDPSGSSTGSAVSVAAGLCDISLGTDVLGSVRWPASHCGMVGLRMTHKAGNLAGVFPCLRAWTPLAGSRAAPMTSTCCYRCLASMVCSASSCRSSSSTGSVSSAMCRNRA